MNKKQKKDLKETRSLWQEEINYWSHYLLPVKQILTPELYLVLSSLRRYLKQECEWNRLLDKLQEQGH